MEGIILQQQEIIALIEQVNANFKKDPSDRKSIEYIAKRLERLDEHWHNFECNHEQLLTFGDKSHEYFTRDMYKQVREYYQATRDLIANFKGKVTLTSDLKCSTEQTESTSMLKKLMSQQKTNFKAFLRQINYCVLDELEEKWELEDELRSIQARWDTIDKLHWQIDNLLEEADPGYDEEYNENDIRYRNIKRKLNQKLSSTDHLKESTPKMEIPTFVGNYTQWPTFYDLFKEAIHFNNTISKSQKMQHLKSKVKGEAERLIQHLHISADNYDAAWDILCQRYNNKQLLFTKQIEVFLNQPLIQKQTSYEIRKLHDISKECLHAINNLGIDTYSWSPLLVHLISKKLDNETYRDYQESRKKPRELADLDELFSFLEAKFIALEPITKVQQTNMTQKTTMTNKNDKIDSNKSNKSYPNSKKPTFTRAYHTNFKSVKCPLCNFDHALYQCRKFASMTPDAKLDTVVKYNMCKNCLYTHELGICKSVNRCKSCNAAHNTLLHDAICFKPSTSNANISSSRTTEQYQKNSNHVDSENEEMLLTTVQVGVKSADGSYVTLNALLDQGSQITLVTENAAQRLGLRRQHINASVTGVGIAAKKGRGKVTLECQSIYDNYEFVTEALVMSKVVNNLPNTSLPNNEYSYLQGIQLADPEYHVSKPIDILFDVKVYSEIIMSGLLRGKTNEPIAQQTKLGWILSGNVSSTFNCHVVISNMEDMSRFWEIEEVTDNNMTKLTEREQWCEDFYESTTKRGQDGRYEVRLPMTEKFEERLGPSKPKAIAQFRQLESRLLKNELLNDNYKMFMEEYITLGHMKKCVTKKEPSCFLPHHDVHKQESTTTKLRVVFNASSKTQSGYSLNDLMECGPKLHNDIQGLLINWRSFRFVYSADCEKMYRMILVHENDQHLQKIIWRDSPQNPLQEYQLCTLTYGTKAAPFLALRTMKQLAKDEAEKYPLAAQVLLNNVYVDDLLAGHNQLDIAKQTQQQLIDMLQGAGINLRKWSSNSSELLHHLSKDQLNPSVIDFKHAESTKTLGLRWEPTTDSFKFQSKLDHDIDINTTKYTKRMMLSDISKLFDPLGWLSPITIKAKLLFQRAWSSSIGWDDVIADDILCEWVKLRADLKNINKFEIPRWVGNTERPIQLHGFSDASEKGLACSVYVKTIDEKGHNIIRLLAAKTKLAPVKKPVSLPRLELCASVLLTKLVKKILTSMPDNLEIQIYGYTDSMVVLGWLQGDISRWKTFVANRVKEIIDIMPASSWRHTKSEDNAADCATRGMTPSQLINHSLWWEGPGWLNGDILPEVKMCDPPKIETKIKKQALFVQLTPSSIILDIVNKHSSLTRASRIICWISRFIQRTRRISDVALSEHLTANEMRVARQLIIRTVQSQHFSEDIARLKAKQNLKSKSTLLTLNPFLDDDDILRVGGRLQHSKLSYNKKHPILIPHDSHLTRLIINEAHSATLHGGASLTLSHCRDLYWIISGIRAVKKQIRQCIKCQRFKAQSQHQLMANLPEPRVTPSKPFTHTGVDFTGYVDIKANKGRGIKTLKGYIAVFVCFSTKAVHLELVADLSAAAFLAAFKRMCARRGMPKHMYSDNGTNFVGAAKVLTKEYKEALKTINTECVSDISNMGVTWHFNAPAWPSAGGLWESSVKSVKHHLKRVIGEQKLTFEEFYTLLTQIEACLNSRPLYALSENIEEDVMTPGHFLVGEPLLAAPLSDPEEPMSMHTRWLMIEKMHKSFWQKWSAEYLHHLQKRTKWQHDRPDLQIDDIVLINEDNMPPSKWALAKIVDVHPGKDGHVRVVTLKTKNGTIKRPIVKLTPLPVRQECDNTDPTKTDSKEDKPTSRDQNRCRRVQKRPNVLLATLILLMTFITPSVQEMSNVTTIGTNTTLYFDKIADMRIVQDQWKMVVYYNMTNYWQSMTDIQNYLGHLKNICKDDTTFRPILSQFDHELNEMTHYNDLLQTQVTNRVKRGLVNAIGNIANSLFGVLDDKFAEQYEKDIETVRKTESHLFKMLKNQTSILEAENNILKRNEGIMNQHFTYINQILKNMSQEINDVKQANANHLKMFYIITTALSTDVIITNLRRIQETLIDTITNIYHGQLDIHLISPSQLQNQLNIISGQLQGELVIPTDNIKDLYQLLQVHVKVTKMYLIMEIKIPLLSHDQFELDKIISLPWMNDKRTVYNIPSTPYIAVNMKKDMIMPINDNDFHSCIKFNSILLCYENHPIYNVHFDQSLCEMRLFKNNDKQTYCRSEITHCSDRWIKLQSTGAWLFSCCRECSVRILCPAGLETKYLQGNGVIDIGQGCVVKGDIFTIHAQHDYANKMYLQKKIDIPALHKYTSSLNDIISTSMNENMVQNLETHDQLFDEINQRIEVLKSKDLQQLQDSSAVHYSTIYAILAMLIVIFGVYIGCKLRGRCVPARWPPRAARGERAVSLELNRNQGVSASANSVSAVCDSELRTNTTVPIGLDMSGSVLSVDRATSPTFTRTIKFKNLPEP
ncbi:hypothetical protein ABMA27_014364 [Loxostege sticticalis]|uniref:Integrase catalytic domain-containing protein n=1 Tax=Loxostege sticticalis TaxID=481309 RepID=A0ABR3I8Q0_LOXSC